MVLFDEVELCLLEYCARTGGYMRSTSGLYIFCLVVTVLHGAVPLPRSGQSFILESFMEPPT